jgi:hypothetical protein
MKEGWFATNTKVMFFTLVKTTSFTFVENYLGHYWILSTDHTPAVRRNVYFCSCYLSLEAKAKITKRADTS